MLPRKIWKTSLIWHFLTISATELIFLQKTSEARLGSSKGSWSRSSKPAKEWTSKAYSEVFKLCVKDLKKSVFKSAFLMKHFSKAFWQNILVNQILISLGNLQLATCCFNDLLVFNNHQFKTTRRVFIKLYWYTFIIHRFLNAFHQQIDWIIDSSIASLQKVSAPIRCSVLKDEIDN